jgi:hypothetical protein
MNKRLRVCIFLSAVIMFCISSVVYAEMTESSTHISNVPAEYACNQNDECILVTSYIPPHGEDIPGKTLIHCFHKDRALESGERISEYNDYLKSTCICSEKSKKCEMRE